MSSSVKESVRGGPPCGLDKATEEQDKCSSCISRYMADICIQPETCQEAKAGMKCVFRCHWKELARMSNVDGIVARHESRVVNLNLIKLVGTQF